MTKLWSLLFARTGIGYAIENTITYGGPERDYFVICAVWPRKQPLARPWFRGDEQEGSVE